MRGYKAFDADFCSTLGFQYAVGQTYTHTGTVSVSRGGFHFCIVPSDCKEYYYTRGTRYAEVRADGLVDYRSNICATNKITIVREMSAAEFDAASTGRFVFPDGSTQWRSRGLLHHAHGPAVEMVDGTKLWCINDQLHNDNGPAVERTDGTKLWCRNNQLHNDDGPAVQLADGRTLWYSRGKLRSRL